MDTIYTNSYIYFKQIINWTNTSSKRYEHATSQIEMNTGRSEVYDLELKRESNDR